MKTSLIMDQKVIDACIKNANKMLDAARVKQYDKMLDFISKLRLPQGFPSNVKRTNDDVVASTNFDDDLPF
ncbi:MAG: hypothetical protein IJ894_00395 [Bacteroidales bacterium]|jgi:hypothetical protein|nr:hypothetical protein [Bacteroidales bacterium]MBQ2098490.1 hypothetical protein [Bacteroidales bacterium]MBR2103799.1 hypothetical protein [Bacteroidales bacterium]MBR2199200.1 hypothetical protein [Bacteroidales bacterium]MBR3714131.1 hypothetical protein [Bacteroidales bacterium]